MSKENQNSSSNFKINEGASTSADYGNQSRNTCYTQTESSSSINYLDEEFFAAAIAAATANANRQYIPVVQDSVCLFCKKTSNRQLTSVNEKQDLQEALKIINIPYHRLPTVEDFVCHHCVYRVLTIQGFKINIERNLLKSRANYFYNNGKKDFCKRYLEISNRNNKFISINKTSYGSNNFENLQLDSDESDNGFFEEIEEINKKSFSPIVEMYSEIPTDVVETESGGSKYNKNIKEIIEPIVCKFCGKKFSSETLLRKHKRRLHALQVGTSKSKNLENLKSQNIIAQFTCEKCQDNFENLYLLKRHTFDFHKRLVKCKKCNKRNFASVANWEMHEEECLGTIIKLHDKVRDRKRFYRSRSCVSTESSIRRSDRLRKRIQSINREDLYSNPDSIFTKTTKSNNDNSKNKKSEMECDNTYSQSNKLPEVTNFSRISSRISNCTHITLSDSEDENEGIQFDNNEVYGISTNSNDLKLYRSAISNTYPQEFGYPHITSTPHLVRPNSNQIFNCLEKTCEYQDTDITKLMQHDIYYHNKLPLYFCKKCRGSFIRRFYYEQHLLYQNYGWYFCIKCEKKFDFEFQLKQHLALHKRARTLHHCSACNLMFLSSNDLETHCLSLKHQNNTLKKPIVFKRYDYNVDLKDSLLQSNEVLYESKIKLLKLMDTERTPELELLTWYPGVPVEPNNKNIINCSIPSIKKLMIQQSFEDCQDTSQS